MRHILLSLSICTLLLASFSTSAAPTTKPASAATKPAGGRLFMPYSRLESLTDEQRVQIREIHRKVLAEKRDIEAKETSDIAALLTDEQKKELHEIEAKSTVETKSKAMTEEK